MGNEASSESDVTSREIPTAVRAKPKAKAKRRLERWEEVGEDDPTMRDPSDIILAGESAATEDPEDVKAHASSASVGGEEDTSPDLGTVEDSNLDAPEVSTLVLKSFEERVLSISAQGRAQASGSQLAIAGGDAPVEAEEEEDEEEPLEDVGVENEAEVQARMDELKLREKMLEEEQESRDLMSRRDIEYAMNSVRASRVIVGVAKVKLQMVKKQMKLYEEAEASGNEANARARKLLTWTSLLSVLQRFDEKMRTPDILKAKNERFLASLPPPPPPPPPELPPDEGDEDLHEKYEEMVQRYEAKWKHEGRMVLGAERFDEIRNRAKGPAEKQKQRVAAARLARAKWVLSENEYQELLRDAWRLGDNHSALEEYDKKEWARQVNLMSIGDNVKR
mmetsp:Transcript_10279/g.18083  ORF Transcript_10279/g.18083 Transcript_10279/m.18083 type:complete len:393 (+) Transcript_10279:69-1247(+)